MARKFESTDSQVCVCSDLKRGAGAYSRNRSIPQKKKNDGYNFLHDEHQKRFFGPQKEGAKKKIK